MHLALPYREEVENEYGIYQVGLKALLHKEDKVLLPRDRETGRLDLPGGRIDVSELRMPLTDILAREVREELGEDMRYELGAPIGCFRRYHPQKKTSVFIVVYDATWISGEIVLSEELASYEWVRGNEYVFQEDDFGTNVEEASVMKDLLSR